jgi:hypothetical protein
MAAKTERKADDEIESEHGAKCLRFHDGTIMKITRAHRSGKLDVWNPIACLPIADWYTLRGD